VASSGKNSQTDVGWKIGVDDGTRTPASQTGHLESDNPLKKYDRPGSQIIDPGPQKETQANGLWKIGVDDGTRTHDDRDHNPGLYQLSYAHHGFAYLTKSEPIWRARQDSNLQPSA
jgi:hypothetical protein